MMPDEVHQPLKVLLGAGLRHHSRNQERAMTSPLFTSETMITRALAAELRHDDSRFRAAVPPGLGSQLVDVRCEAEQRLDVLLTYEDGTRIGIEGKLDHQITEGQLERERDVCDVLVLVVIDPRDASKEDREHVHKVLTWAETLELFTDSRLLPTDITAVKTSKRSVERLMSEALSTTKPFGEGWTVDVKRQGAGMAALWVIGPVLPTPWSSEDRPRRLRGELQVLRESARAPLDEVRLSYHPGFSVDADQVDFPADITEKPVWVDALRVLAELLSEGGALARFDKDELLTSGKPGTPKLKAAESKKRISEHYLPDHQYLAKGTADWSLGPRSKAQGIEQIPQMIADMREMFLAWDAALRG